MGSFPGRIGIWPREQNILNKTRARNWHDRVAKGRKFTVSVACRETRGCRGYLPKPIMEGPGRPSRITYGIVRGEIEVTAAKGQR